MFASAVSASFLNLIYHGAGTVVHLLLLKGSMVWLFGRSACSSPATTKYLHGWYNANNNKIWVPWFRPFSDMIFRGPERGRRRGRVPLLGQLVNLVQQRHRLVFLLHRLDQGPRSSEMWIRWSNIVLSLIWTSVTRWLYYFSRFGHVQQWKLAQ